MKSKAKPLSRMQSANEQFAMTVGRNLADNGYLTSHMMVWNGHNHFIFIIRPECPLPVMCKTIVEAAGIMKPPAP